MKIFAAMVASAQVRMPKRRVALKRELALIQRRRGRMGGRAVMGRVFRTNARHGQGGKAPARRRRRQWTCYGAMVAVKATEGSLVRRFAGSEKNA
jgi:hypothetical protein